MKKLENLTLKLTKYYLSKNNKIEAMLFLNWDKIFAKTNNIHKPKRVLFSKNLKNNGTLILEVKRGFELEVQMETINILNEINNFLGYKAIDNIKIKKENF